jgi:hypothetical protein
MATQPIIPYTQPGKPVQPAWKPNDPNDPKQNQQGGGTGTATATGQAPNVSTMATPGQFNVPQVPTQSTGQNQNVLQAAQNKAIQGANNQTLNMTSALTQQQLQNPQGQFNPQQQVQRGMEQFDFDRAQAMQAAQEELAPVWNTGAGAEKYIDLGTRGALDRATLKQQMDQAANEQSLSNIYDAIQAGRETSEQERAGYSTDIGALVDVRGAAEGQENRNFQAQAQAIDNAMQLATQFNDIQAQESLAQLNAKLEEGLLMKEQDFQSIQADLDRQQQLLLQENDFVGAERIERLKQEFQSLEAQKEREFTQAERIATQGWQTGERLSAQDFELGRMYYESELAEAQAENDFDRQRQILEQQQLHELKMQTNEMDYGQKMAYLDYNLSEARATNDVERQQQILKFKHGQEMERLASEQGFQAAMQYNDFQYQQALSEQDFVQAETLARQRMEFEAEENLQDRMLEQARIQLQQQGMDLAQFDRLQAEVEAGRVDPDAAVQYLQEMVGQSGLNLQISPVEAETQMRTAIQAEYDSMRYQYALTHPEQTDPETGELTDEGKAAFNEFYNENLYGEESGTSRISNAIADSTAYLGGDNPNSPNHSDYLALAESAPTVDFSSYVDDSGANTMRFSNPPAVNSIFTVDGRVYKALTSPKRKRVFGGVNRETMTILDLASGTVKTLDSRHQRRQ